MLQHLIFSLSSLKTKSTYLQSTDTIFISTQRNYGNRSCRWNGETYCWVKMELWKISELFKCASCKRWSYNKEERSTSCSSRFCFSIEKMWGSNFKTFLYSKVVLKMLNEWHLHPSISRAFRPIRGEKVPASWWFFCRTSPTIAR